MLCVHDSFQNSEITVKWDNWNYPNLIYNPQRNTEHQEGEDGGTTMTRDQPKAAKPLLAWG